MKAKITLECDGKHITGDTYFQGTQADKLAFCDSFLNAMHVTKEEAMLLAMLYRGGSEHNAEGETGTETRIDLSEYLKQKGEEE